MDYGLIVSVSRIKKFRTCEKQFAYQYDEQLEPRVKDPRLETGSLIHECLECAAKGENWKGPIKESRKKFDKLFPEEQLDHAHVIPSTKEMMRGYFRRWKDEPFEYKMVEQTIGPVTLVKDPPIGFIGIVDGLLVKESGRFALLERKSNAKFPEPGIRINDLQSHLYVWALRKMGYDVDEIIWDEIRTKIPTVPRALVRGGVSRKKSVDTTWAVYKKAVIAAGCDPDDYLDMREILRVNKDKFFRRQYHPVKEQLLKNLVTHARRTARQIHLAKVIEKPVVETGFHCRFCSFEKICIVEMNGGDASFMKKADFRRRDRGKKKRERKTA